MELNRYEIIQYPLVTSKASLIVEKLKKIVLKVHIFANKKQIKEALEKLFGVRVSSVNIIIRKGKAKKVKRKISHGIRAKHAIVTLKDKESFDILTKAKPMTHEASSIIDAQNNA